MTPYDLESLTDWVSRHCPGVQLEPDVRSFAADQGLQHGAGYGDAAASEAASEPSVLRVRWLQYRRVLDARLARRGDVPIRVLQRFLLFADRPGDPAAANAVQMLLLRALDDSGLSIDLDGLTPELWSHLGLFGRPGFLIDLPVVEARVFAEAPPVQQVKLALLSTGSLRGVVRWSHGAPIAGAEVSVRGGRTAAVASASGSFRLCAGAIDRAPDFHVRVRHGEALRSPRAVTLQGDLWMLELEHEAVAHSGDDQ